MPWYTRVVQHISASKLVSTLRETKKQLVACCRSLRRYKSPTETNMAANVLLFDVVEPCTEMNFKPLTVGRPVSLLPVVFTVPWAL